MNKKQREVKKIGCVVAGLGFWVLFVGASVFGMLEYWYRFGFFLTGCIIMAIIFIGIFIELGVDMRLNQLEKFIDELKDKKPKDEQKQ
jgi:bacteriorhodopsin